MRVCGGVVERGACVSHNTPCSCALQTTPQPGPARPGPALPLPSPAQLDPPHNTHPPTHPPTQAVVEMQTREPAAGVDGRGPPALALHLAGEVLSAHHVLGDLLRRHRADRLQQLHLLVADVFRLQRHGRFHGHQREHLQDVILHHVAHGTRFLVVAAARSHTDLLGDGDLHVVDRVAIPQMLEDSVAEAEGEDVLDRLLSEVVVDAEDLPLVGEADEFRVQFARAGQVVAEGLFHHQTLGGDAALMLVQQADAVQVLGNLAELARRFERGDFDLVGIGRALLGNADWVSRIRRGDVEGMTGFDADRLMDGLV